jgi:hypothetical protein
MSEAEILMGHKEIARFLGLTPRQVSWMDENGRLPTFRLGRRPCARPETLRSWLRDQEDRARKERLAGGSR